MAHMLVQQQTRTPNISIHRSTSSQKDSTLTMTHSVDDRLFLCKHDSTRLLNLLTRFASEPQMSMYHTQSTNLNGDSNKNHVVFALSSPVSNTCLELNQPDKDEINFEDIFNLNCDKIQPVLTSLTDDFNSDKLDIISTNTIITSSSIEQLIAIDHDDELKHQQLNEDIIFDSSPSIDGNDILNERHFRRRKRRSSLTRTSISLDDTQPVINLIEKLDINKQQSQEINEQENLELSLSIKENDDKENNNNITETKTSEKEQSNETITDDEKSASCSRYRGRRLRHRFYRHAASTSSPEEVTLTRPVDFFLHDDAFDNEIPRIHSPPPSSPIIISPLPSPLSPIPTITSNQTTPNKLTSGLKRTGSVGTTKKNVRFADSMGRELAQVKYIRSTINDESKELSFLLGSSLLSSSPPSFTKNNLYVPKRSGLEHKPWSFDVAVTQKTLTKEMSIPKRFFCLYRQPNSEHPDIYLHEVWKSQIKLERADIPLRYSITGEQQLIGTLWVTNASYFKYVSIKYTFNRWLNTYEHETQHCCSSHDYRNLDQFEFTIDIPTDVDRIDFVLRYCVNGQEYWDNNEGKDYTLQTESAYTPQTTISLPHDCDFNEMRFY